MLCVIVCPFQLVFIREPRLRLPHWVPHKTAHRVEVRATFSHLQTSANLHWNLRHCETLCDHHIQNSSKLSIDIHSGLYIAPILRTNSSWRAQWNCNCRPLDSLDSGAHIFVQSWGNFAQLSFIACMIYRFTDCQACSARLLGSPQSQHFASLFAHRPRSPGCCDAAPKGPIYVQMQSYAWIQKLTEHAPCLPLPKFRI